MGPDPRHFGRYSHDLGSFSRHATAIPQINVIQVHGSVYWYKSEASIAISYDLSESTKRVEGVAQLSDKAFFDVLLDKTKTEKHLELAAADLKTSDKQHQKFWDEYKALPVVNPTKWKFHETVFEEHYSNISHHAISRLMERGASTPETLKADVLQILQKARSLRTMLSSGFEHNLTKLKDDMTYDMLMPHGDGALVLRTLRVNAAAKSFFPDPMPVFSIRTYLERSMLGPRDLERMAGFRISRDATVSVEDSRHILAWLQGNAEETDPRRRLVISQEPGEGLPQ